MSQTNTQNGPTANHHDFYPVMRVSFEFFMRSLDLLGQLHDDVTSGSIMMTLWYDLLAGSGHKPMAVRKLSRRLNLPYETVRRHVRELDRRGACVVKDSGVTVPHAFHGSARATRMLRKIYVNAVRLLADLTRIGATAFPPASRRAPPSGRLAKEQNVIAVAAMGLLLAGVRTMRDFWGGDLMKGMVFTAIWTANVKHVTNTSLVGTARQPAPACQRARDFPLAAPALRDGPAARRRARAGRLVRARRASGCFRAHTCA